MAKASKHDVDYSIGMIESHCGKVFKDDKGYCRFYHHEGLDKGWCEKVSGDINSVYWCKLFEKAK